MDEIEGLIAEQPAQCAGCGNWFELNDMWGSLYSTAVVCESCHRNEHADRAED